MPLRCGFNFYDHIPHPIAVADATLPGRPLVYVNRAFEEMTGHAAAEVLGRNCGFLQGARTNPATVEEIRRCLNEGTPFVGEILNYTKSGRPFWNHLRITPCYDDSGVMTHFIASQTNLSGTCGLESRIGGESVPVSSILSSLPLLIWACTDSGHPLYFNEQWQAFRGRTPEEEMSCWLDAVHPEDQAILQAQMQGTRSSGKTSVAFRLMNRTGEYRHLEGTLGALESSDLPVPALVCTAIDVTSRRQVEEQNRLLVERSASLRRNESLRVMASAVAHEFNNQLTAIMANAELAAFDVPIGSPVSLSIDTIQQASRRCADLCRQLVSFAEREMLVRTTFPIARMINRAVSEALGASGDLETRVAIHLDLPNPLLHGDEHKLRTALVEVLTNALEARVEGKQHRLSIHAANQVTQSDGAPASGDLRITIRDNGVGMNAATLASCMDPFATTKGLGRGLGLASAHGALRAHGGSLRLESEPGNGTSVHITVPCSPPPTLGARVRESSPPSSTTST